MEKEKIIEDEDIILGESGEEDAEEVEMNKQIKFLDKVPLPKPPKKEKWAGLSEAKVKHLKNLQEQNRIRREQKKKEDEELLETAKKIINAKKTIKEAEDLEEFDEKIIKKAQKKPKGRPKKEIVIPDVESEESESSDSDATPMELPKKPPKKAKKEAPPKKAKPQARQKKKKVVVETSESESESDATPAQQYQYPPAFSGFV